MVDNNLTYAVKRRALDKVAGDRNFIYSYFLSLTYMAWDNSSSFNQISNRHNSNVFHYIITNTVFKWTSLQNYPISFWPFL